MGRIGSAIYLLAVAKLGWSPEQTALYMVPIYILGIIVALMGPETWGQ